MTVRKRFGQHFLEPQWVDKLVDAISPQPSEMFLEIGPGRGALTEPLLVRGAVVHAVEIDRDLAAALSRRGHPALHVHEGDFLDMPTSTWWNGQQAYRVAANLPYNVSTPILLRLLAEARAGVLSDATLMLQKEVVQRMIAVPDTSEYGPLAIAVQLDADVRRLFVLPPGAFRPPPAVQSAVVRLDFRPPLIPIDDRAAFDTLVRHLFTMRRKTLRRALRPLAEQLGISAESWLAAAGVDGTVRAETLAISALAQLAAAQPAATQ